MRTRIVIAALFVVLLSGLVAPSASADEGVAVPTAAAGTDAPDPAGDGSDDPPGEAADEADSQDAAGDSSSSSDSQPSTGGSTASAPSTSEPAADKPAATADPATEETPSAAPVDETSVAVPDDAAADAPAAPVVAAAATAAAAAATAHDPRASIGDVDCEGMTVPVTLDNSRSTGPSTFNVSAFLGDADNPFYDHTDTVAGGATQVVQIPVVEDSQIIVAVDDDGITPPEPFGLAFSVINVDCTPDDTAHDPSASIGDVECQQMTVPVTLNNSRSSDSTTFEVIAERFTTTDAAYDKDFVVPAGETLVVHVPVTEDDKVFVGVADHVVLDATDEEEGVLAVELLDIDCVPGRPQRQASASIGDVNCTTLTVPVTLDNSRADVAQDFMISSGDLDSDNDGSPHIRTVTVPAGGTVVADVAVTNHHETIFFVSVENRLVPLAFDFVDVSCRRPAAAVVPRSLAQLPRTGGVSVVLPLLGLALLISGVGLVALGRRRTV